MSREEKQKLYSNIVKFLKNKGAVMIAVFGSFVRDEETTKSDIDVLVDFNKPMGLLEFVRIERELGEYIGIKVDLVMDGGINPLVEKYISEEKIVLF